MHFSTGEHWHRFEVMSVVSVTFGQTNLRTALRAYRSDEQEISTLSNDVEVKARSKNNNPGPHPPRASARMPITQQVSHPSSEAGIKRREDCSYSLMRRVLKLVVFGKPPRKSGSQKVLFRR